MAELKTQKTSVTPQKFIATITDAQKRADSKKLLAIFQKATGKKPAMWGASIVGFGTYQYQRSGSKQKLDWFVAGFSPRAQNITLYILCGTKPIQEDLKKLGKHTVSGGSCIYFKKLEDIDTAVLHRIIKKSLTLKKIGEK